MNHLLGCLNQIIACPHKRNPSSFWRFAVANQLANVIIWSNKGGYAFQEEDIGTDTTHSVTGLDACTMYNVSVTVVWDGGDASDVQMITEETSPAGLCACMKQIKRPVSCVIYFRALWCNIPGSV